MPDTPPDRIGFAPPLSEIRAVPVTEEPAGGRGFSLNEKGEVPIASNAGRWTMEYVEVTADLSNLAAHSGAAGNFTIPGIAVGDLCFFIGIASGISPQLILYTRPPVCTVAGQIGFAIYNADTASLDEGSDTFYFLVIHRFL